VADSGVARWLASPMHLGFFGLVMAGVFALLHLFLAAGGNLSAFILVGAPQVHHPSQVPHGITVYPNPGYDGQFYYRLALDPLDWAHTAFGISLDYPYRIARIAYPALVWLFAAGHAGAVPTALVVVNVVAFAVLVACAGALAHDARRHPAWGLLLAGYWGFLWTMARDLTELVAATALVAGLLAIRRGRPVTAGVVLIVAVLGRETEMVFVAAVLLTRMVGWARALRRPAPAVHERAGDLDRGGPGRRDLVWVLPCLAFTGWELAVQRSIGVFPVRSSGGQNTGEPFHGLWAGLRMYLPLFPGHTAVPWLWEVLMLAVMVLGALYVFPSTRVLLHERIAWLAYLALSVSLSDEIWTGDVGFRSLNEIFLFSALLLLFSRRRLTVPGVLVCITWLAVFVQLARAV